MIILRKMADLTRQMPLLDESKNYELLVKLLTFLSNKHIKISEDHKEIIRHHRIFTNANSKKDDSENKSSLCSSEGGCNNLADVLPVAADYVNKRDLTYKTPLHLSAEFGNRELVEIFLKVGADVDAKDKYNQTPLHKSSRNNHASIVEILLKSGAEINAVDIYNQTPLQWSAFKSHIDIIKIFIIAGADVAFEGRYTKTPLHWSAFKGDGEIAEILLKAGANVHTVNGKKQTALHWSVQFKHDDVSKLLLNAGASIKKRDFWGESVLDYMDDSQRARLLSSPASKLFKLRNWVHSMTNTVKVFENPGSTRAEIKQRETVSTTFTSHIQNIQYQNCSSSKDQNDISKSKESSTLQDSGTSHNGLAVASSDLERLSDFSPSVEHFDLSDGDLQELNNISQQLQEHIKKFAPEHKEGWETSCSNNVKAAFQAGIIVIPTTINITNIKKIKNIKKIHKSYGPGTHLNINHAEIVAPSSQVFVQPNINSSSDDDSDDEDSCIEDEINNHN